MPCHLCQIQKNAIPGIPPYSYCKKRDRQTDRQTHRLIRASGSYTLSCIDNRQDKTRKQTPPRLLLTTEKNDEVDDRPKDSRGRLLWEIKTDICPHNDECEDCGELEGADQFQKCGYHDYCLDEEQMQRNFEGNWICPVCSTDPEFTDAELKSDSSAETSSSPKTSSIGHSPVSSSTSKSRRWPSRRGGRRQPNHQCLLPPLRFGR